MNYAIALGVVLASTSTGKFILGKKESIKSPFWAYVESKPYFSVPVAISLVLAAVLVFAGLRFLAVIIALLAGLAWMYFTMPKGMKDLGKA